MTTAQHRTNLNDLHSRLSDIEARLAKYDVIIEHLNTLLEILTERVEKTAERADEAIEGQGLLQQRNESAHRWSAVGIALASSVVVGVLMFLVGYVLH